MAITQSEVSLRIQTLIPKDLWAKFTHLSYAEMAEREEFVEWRAELRQAEEDWFAAEDA